MKKLLHGIQHLSFVVFTVFAFVFFLVPRFTYHGASGTVDVSLGSTDANVNFYDSVHFNKMFGLSLSEAVKYAAVNNTLNSDEYKETVSGNALSEDRTLYDKASAYSAYYDASNSSFRYIITQGEGRERVVYTNYSTEELTPSFVSTTIGRTVKNVYLKDLSNEELKKLTEALCIRLLYLDAGEHIYETNTQIDENTVYYLLNHADGRFADDTAVIAGILPIRPEDTLRSDEYRRAYYRYTLFSSYYWLILSVLAISGFLYLALLLVLTVKEGNGYDKELKCSVLKLAPSDHLPLELRILALFVCALPYCFLYRSRAARTVALNIIDGGTNEGILVLAILALLTSLLISFFYYGLVRRIKGRVIWKTSLIARLVQKLASGAGDLYAHASLAVRAYLPSAVVLMLVVVIMLLLGGVGSALAAREGAYLRLSRRLVLADALLIFLAVATVIDGTVVYRRLKERESIISVIHKIAGGDAKAKVDPDTLHGENLPLGEAVNEIGDSIKSAVETSMKDEKLKADLITNVSHDLKTPLTSIINYVDLLKKEKIENETAESYIRVLDEKSQRLKQLTDDLVEASKISSGNIVLSPERINLKELLSQALGEFSDRFDARSLTVVSTLPEDNLSISADPRSIYRVIENLYTNICKYALPGTRVYVDASREEEQVLLSFKNISENPLAVTPEELTERFIRGDEARTTEGSGLGLSIARSLTEAMGGFFRIVLDGDLFKVELKFKEEK